MNKETTARKRWPHQCRGQSQWRTQWSIRVLAQSQESMGRPRVMSLHRWASRGGATWRTMTSDQLGCRDLIKRSFNWMTDGEMWREGVCVCVVTMLHHQFILKHIHWPRHTHSHCSNCSRTLYWIKYLQEMSRNLSFKENQVMFRAATKLYLQYVQKVISVCLMMNAVYS